MATVAELVQLVCDESGLDSAANSEDRLFALARLNAVYGRLVADLEFDDEVTIAASAAGADVDVSSSLVEVSHLAWRDAADAQTVLTRVSSSDLFALRSASQGTVASGSEVPTAYTFSYPNVMLHPTPGAAGELVAFGVVAAPTLVEGAPASAAQEATPSLIPVTFHESVLARGTLVRVLEGYEGQEERAAYHRRLLEGDDGRSGEMMKLREWRRRSGGRASARRAYSPWSTPDRIGAR